MSTAREGSCHEIYIGNRHRGRDRQTERVYRLRGGPGWEGLSPRVHKLLTKLQVQGLGTPVIRHLTFATTSLPQISKKAIPITHTPVCPAPASRSLI